jgi:hypothetical protein
LTDDLLPLWSRKGPVEELDRNYTGQAGLFNSWKTPECLSWTELNFLSR